MPTTTDYEKLGFFIIALMMRKPAARQEFLTRFGDFRLEEVFPGRLLGVARWVLEADRELTLGLAESKFQSLAEPITEAVYRVKPGDLLASAVNLDSFLNAYQVREVERLGLRYDPKRTILDQIDEWTFKLTALVQRRMAAEDSHGDRIFQQTRRDMQIYGQGYLRFHCKPFDKYLPGMNFTDGDLGVFYGREKTGKTRGWINLVLRFLMNYPDFKVSILSTEPLVSPRKILFRMWSMLIAETAMREGRTIDISPTKLDMMVESDQEWKEKAAVRLADLSKRMFIYGPALVHGNASYLPTAMQLLQHDFVARQVKLAVVDNFNQMHLPPRKDGSTPSDYDVMRDVVSGLIDRLIAAYQPVFFGVSQVERTQGLLKGGGGLTDRLNFGVKTIRPDKNSPDKILYKCEYSRDTDNWEETCHQFPYSGWLIEE